MPLVRLELKNEYSLGMPELYKEANAEDPRTILEGVTVAGLVGVLRQLGDLAEFAAEVFHSLQEQVATTTSRSHQLINRLKQLESTLPSLEKAVLGQRSHLHFAYTSGSTWRTHIMFEKNHCLYSDMPKSIMDSYEDCRGPPNLHLLDRFDPGGPGSCMKRYSDPLIFKRVSASSDETSTSKVVKDKTDRKIKRRRPRARSEVPKFASVSNNSGRIQFPRDTVGRRSPSFPTQSSWDASSLGSSIALHSKLGLDDSSGSFRSKLCPDHSESPKGRYFREHISSPVHASDAGFIDFNPVEEKITVPPDRVDFSSASERWNEKAEPFHPRLQESETYGSNLDHGTDGQSLSQDMDMENGGNDTCDIQKLQKIDVQPPPEEQFDENIGVQTVDDSHLFNDTMQSLEHLDVHVHMDNNESEPDLFLDALNAIDSETEPELESEKVQEAVNHLEERHMDEVMKLSLECIDESSSSTQSETEPELGLEKVKGAVHELEGKLKFNLERSTESSASAQSYKVTDKDDVVYQSPSVLNESVDSSDEPPNDANNSACLVQGTLQPSQMDSPLYHENGTISCANTLVSAQPTAPSNGRDDSSEMLINHSPESQESSSETTAGASVTFWTNGSLLGLQPSTPPDFKRTTTEPPVGHEKITEDTPLIINLSHKDAVKAVQENPRNVDDDVDIDGSRWKTAWKLPPSDLDVKSDSRLLSFGSTKKVFPGEKENVPGDYQKTGFSDQKNHLDVANRPFSVQPDSSLISPSSSPPLQHMKISFQPMDVLANSQLKLKFHHNNTDDQNGCDYFPSFQLVPKVLDKEDNSGSVSDADTFNESSRSLSDECHSDQNDFVSDCESNYSPTGKEHDLYSSLQKSSLTGSVSTAPPGFGRTDYLDIECWQNLDTHGNSSRNETRTNTTSKEVTQPQAASTPAPPPHSQWQSIRPLINALEEKCRSFSEGSYSTSAVFTSHPAPKKDLTDITNSRSIKKSFSQKSEPDTEASHEKNTRQNDFLHQIRTRSCNLRQTVKPIEEASGSPATTNAQVNLLLKKARGIREAVASDGDDDGEWSETS